MLYINVRNYINFHQSNTHKIEFYIEGLSSKVEKKSVYTHIIIYSLYLAYKGKNQDSYVHYCEDYKLNTRQNCQTVTTYYLSLSSPVVKLLTTEGEKDIDTHTQTFGITTFLLLRIHTEKKRNKQKTDFYLLGIYMHT